jgi:hypothetical protein
VSVAGGRAAAAGAERGAGRRAARLGERCGLAVIQASEQAASGVKAREAREVIAGSVCSSLRVERGAQAVAGRARSTAQRAGTGGPGARRWFGWCGSSAGQVQQLWRERERAGAGRHKRNGCAGVEHASDDRSRVVTNGSGMS